MPNTDQVFATFERDIRGIDYEEVATFISDLEWWADELDDELAREFGLQTSINDIKKGSHYENLFCCYCSLLKKLIVYQNEVQTLILNYPELLLFHI